VIFINVPLHVFHNGIKTHCYRSLQDASVWTVGTGGCDSPGHKVKYLTYTRLEEEATDSCNQHCHRREAANCNAMEMEGLLRCTEEASTTMELLQTNTCRWNTTWRRQGINYVTRECDVFHIVTGVANELARACDTNNGSVDPVCRQRVVVQNNMW